MGSGSARIRHRLLDIGSNLVDDMYLGVYNGSRKHEPDLEKVLQRAYGIGLEKIFVTAGTLDESMKALKLVRDYDKVENGNKKLFTTFGVHPTRCGEFDTLFSSPEIYIERMKALYDDNKTTIIALGEFGLDYERTNFCDVVTQQKYFVLQLEELGPYTSLPLFLHCRGAGNDLHRILSEHKSCFTKGGVVHSFDGSVAEMKAFIDLGLCIGINGCSLKTEDNCHMVKEIPLDSLMLETDSPWCGIRPSHYSSQFIKTKFEVSKKNWSETAMFKQRNEPQTILNILEVVAALKNIDEKELSEIIYRNTTQVFFPDGN